MALEVYELQSSTAFPVCNKGSAGFKKPHRLIDFSVRSSSMLEMNCSYIMDEPILYELMKKFIDHTETAYKMPVLSADVIFKVQNAIKK